MYLDVNDKIAKDFAVIDLDTGKNLDRCKWANEETGEYKEVIYDGTRLNYQIKEGNIKLVYDPK